MKAIVFESFGDPAEVLQVRELPKPEPGPGQVRVRMLTSPINPSDLLYVRGEYGRRPKLPTSAGFEGAGLVEATGGGILGRLRNGRRVAVLNGHGGNWQQQVLVPARQVVPVPAGLSDEQAATFFVNPASALVMVRSILKVTPGAWLMQTAAGSALGRMVIRLGKVYGFRTINIVRRGEQAEELARAGGDEIVCTANESIETRVHEITKGEGAPYAIDAVGGETGSAVARALAAEGRMLVYGTLANAPLSIESRVLMAGHKTIEGFWLSEWVRRQRTFTMVSLFRQIKKLLAQGVLNTEIGQTFALEEVQAAARAAATPGRQGKVLLRIASE
jgi:NADPH:quinone reductase